MANDTDLQSPQSVQVTTGAGIAIAGAWIAGSAVTITILLIAFVFDPATDAEQAKMNAVSSIIFILLVASPMIAAYSVTRLILSKDE